VGQAVDDRRDRGSFTLASVLTASMIAIGVGGCGDSGDDPTPTSTAPAESSTTTTRAQGSPPDAADYLGATLTSATAGEPGVVVQSVEPDSKSRLKRGDVIVAFNGTAVASPGELSRAIGTPEVGGQFTIRVVRGSHRLTLTEVQSPTAYLGADVKDTTGNPKGAEVVAIAPDSPAVDVGIRRGDVITAVDDTSVRSVRDLLEAIAAYGPGESVTINVFRGSRQLELSPTLAARPTPGAGR
jgi:S1-C subfamily serine protease